MPPAPHQELFSLQLPTFQFHLEQARLRSELRIKNNRANPIDLLAYYIHHANDTTGSEILGEPLSVVQVSGIVMLALYRVLNPHSLATPLFVEILSWISKIPQPPPFFFES